MLKKLTMYIAAFALIGVCNVCAMNKSESEEFEFSENEIEENSNINTNAIVYDMQATQELCELLLKENDLNEGDIIVKKIKMLLEQGADPNEYVITNHPSLGNHKLPAFVVALSKNFSDEVMVDFFQYGANVNIIFTVPLCLGETTLYFKMTPLAYVILTKISYGCKDEELQILNKQIKTLFNKNNAANIFAQLNVYFLYDVTIHGDGPSPMEFNVVTALVNLYHFAFDRQVNNDDAKEKLIAIPKIFETIVTCMLTEYKLEEEPVLISSYWNYLLTLSPEQLTMSVCTKESFINTLIKFNQDN